MEFLKMKVITQFNELDSLPLSEGIKSKVKHHMTEPFEFDESITAGFWQEVSTSLILIEDSDTDKTISEQTESLQHFIRFVTNYPEFVLLINDDECDFILVLSIITSDGGAIYLASPVTNKTQPVQSLLPQAELF